MINIIRLNLLFSIIVPIFLLALAASGATDSCSQPTDPFDAPGSKSGLFEQVGTLKGAAIDLVAHQGVLFTPNGRLFLAWDQHADCVRLWDVLALKPVTDPLKHPGLDAFSVASDGRTVFTSGGGEVWMWNAATSKPRATAKADTKGLSYFDATVDGRRFLTIADGRGTLTVWNSMGERPTKAYELAHVDKLDWAEFDASGAYLVAKVWAGPFHLLRTNTGREVCPPFDTHVGSSTEPCQAPFDPIGRHLAVPVNGGFRILDCRSGKTVAEALLERDLEVDQASFSPDGLLLAVTTWDQHSLANGPVFVFDATAHLLHRLMLGDVFRCQLGANGRFVLCNHGTHPEPELFDVRSGERLQRFPAMPDVSGMAVISPNGGTILVPSKPNTISVYRMRHAAPATRP